MLEALSPSRSLARPGPAARSLDCDGPPVCQLKDGVTALYTPAVGSVPRGHVGATNYESTSWYTLAVVMTFKLLCKVSFNMTRKVYYSGCHSH